ncbi:type II toxin-antitoxin system Phd/YefM family antitoxin [Prosthecobacter dejongeii]|uniref:Antitoxin n=1 Tax=Prosthecobacter dejongeii TaxID=48465 RepID=A0A7W7YJP4_9BACT|nr:type II toxin-antitoxin system Phd/YefM family antitoxin [Prosthecobacter dejongeii]MBB5037448.1 PHD/YefM family antitoxin component YafN of YafNO toxin-antitoxin module [Prosthecobacter dejongeii]
MCLLLGMEISLKDDVVSLTDFSRNTRKHTRALAKNHRPRVLTHNGKAAVVVMSVAAFEALSHEAEEHRLDVRLQTALNDYAKGRPTQPATQAFEGIRRRAATRRQPVP